MAEEFPVWSCRHVFRRGLYPSLAALATRKGPAARSPRTPPFVRSLPMNLAEIKRKSIKELSQLAGELNVESAGSLRRQELIFALLNAHAGARGEIVGSGVLETLVDGFGFLRSPDY